MRVLRRRLPPCPLDRRTLTASTDDTSVGTSSAGRDGARGRGRVGGGCEPAGGEHLPHSRLVHREPPIPKPPLCRGLLRRLPARARLLRFRFGCAAQRSGTRRSSGRPRRRRAAAAPRWIRSCLRLRPRAAACSCTADGGGDSAAALTPIAASGNGAHAVVLGVHVRARCDEQSDDSAIAVHRRIVQRGPATKPAHSGAGVRGWAPRGYPLPKPVPENKTAGSP